MIRHPYAVLPHLTICICTCGRPAMLERLLREISKQEAAGAFIFSVVVTDNDPTESARAVVEKCERECFVGGLQIMYVVEPAKNIALARNTALSHASGDFIVFIDDDEFPAAGWLLSLFRTCESHQVAGVLGPVKPHFEREPPQWLIKGGFYQRPTHPTGFVIPWQECRTGNVLFRHNILDPSEPPFRREFGGGGEDQDFFRRLIERGHRFIWSGEAVAYEVVPPSRWSRRFMIHRALFRGRNTFRHPKHRLRNLLKSVIAVPAYALALPVLLLAGHHYFMKYLVKLVDHVGRLLASVGINPVTERRM
jgi:glycosyltransferase involved in cell wall biosynthesis